MTTTIDPQFHTTATPTSPATGAWSALTSDAQRGPVSPERYQLGQNRVGPQFSEPRSYRAPLSSTDTPPFGAARMSQDVSPVVVQADPTPVRKGIRVDQGRYWVGALLTSAVAAMAGVIGIVIAQDLLRVPLSMASIGLAGAGAGTYALVAVLVAMLASLAYDGMLMFAPRPTVYYCWLAGLLTALAVLLPFTAPVAIGSQAALAIINLVVGVAIMTLVPVAATNARSRS